MTTQNLVHGVETGQWDQAIYAFLAEKERRSGSMRTVRATIQSRQSRTCNQLESYLKWLLSGIDKA